MQRRNLRRKIEKEAKEEVLQTTSK